MEKEKIILGIDPGTRILGFGVIRLSGTKAEFVEMGVVNLKSEKDHFSALKRILSEVSAIIEKYLPDELAIEAPFYGKNAQVMLKLGRAQGMAISAALSHDIPVFEYPPRSVKMAVTGRGGASKEQVAAMAAVAGTVRKVVLSLPPIRAMWAMPCITRHCANGWKISV